MLPRFCEQTLERSWKAELYGQPLKNIPWVAKLDTIIHELYHIDPAAAGLRQFAHADGTRATAHARARVLRGRRGDDARSTSRRTRIRRLIDFLRWDFAALHARFGGVTATTFRNFPSFPQRYMEPCTALPVESPTG